MVGIRMLDAPRAGPRHAIEHGAGSDAASPDELFCRRLERLDRDAWESAYLEHRRLVSAIVASSVGYGAGLDDVVQEVFVTAVSLVQSGHVRLHGDRTGVRAWLLAIASRLARAEARRRRKALVRTVQDDGDALSCPVEDPALVQTLKRTHHLLTQLPDRLRMPWVLRHLEQMTIEEIALSLGVSAATTKRRLSRADQSFRRLVLRDPVVREYLEPESSR
jgi:RNA polymerase sigma factor (sigma-70 family)